MIGVPPAVLSRLLDCVLLRMEDVGSAVGLGQWLTANWGLARWRSESAGRPGWRIGATCLALVLLMLPGEGLVGVQRCADQVSEQLLDPGADEGQVG